MAKLFIDRTLHLGIRDRHTSTSWEVSLHEDFSVLIDSSYEDTENKLVWITPLPKPDGISYYKDVDMLYGRMKVHMGEDESPWHMVDDSQIVRGTSPDVNWNETCMDTYSDNIKGERQC